MLLLVETHIHTAAKGADHHLEEETLNPANAR
jgi:hypothetical protein